MELLLNILVFNIWLPKGEKEKDDEGEKCTGLLNSLEFNGGGVTTMPACFFVMRHNDGLRFFFLILTPLICVQAAPGTQGPLLPQGWGWGLGSCYSAKS